MNALILKDVRCFAHPAPVPLRPLTLLVGENSAGKSTFLAATRLASQLALRIETPDFNAEPFGWGAFDQIANYRGGRVGRAREFTIGLDIDLPGDLSPAVRNRLPSNFRISGTFANSSSQPFLRNWKAMAGPYAFIYDQKDPTGEISITLAFPGGKTISSSQHGSLAWALASEIEFLIHVVLARQHQKNPDLSVTGDIPSEEHRLILLNLFADIKRSLPVEVHALAPIRTEPKRTYDPTKDTPRPSGGHVPMILAKTYGGSAWRDMKESLENFGNASGLFHGVEVKRLGRQESSPFQILIKIAGPAFNLVDVGYGVSQALPIVVDLLQGKRGQMFLIQQPEVHLHPRSQAELGTLLAQLVKTDKKQIIVETHSDYLIDRVRMDIRDGKTLRPDDVTILYFERGRSGVEIHHLTIDESGNLEGAPPSYRSFFLNEERRFLVPST